MYFHSLLKTGYNVHTHRVIFNKVLLRSGAGEGGIRAFIRQKGGMHRKRLGTSAVWRLLSGGLTGCGRWRSSCYRPGPPGHHVRRPVPACRVTTRHDRSQSVTQSRLQSAVRHRPLTGGGPLQSLSANSKQSPWRQSARGPYYTT